MNPNETTQVYSFFRKKPFDRYMGRDSLHRMTISSWENISTHQFVKIAANLATFAIAITFARRLTKPIINLITASENISKGELNTKVPDIEADEEIKSKIARSAETK